MKRSSLTHWAKNSLITGQRSSKPRGSENAHASVGSRTRRDPVDHGTRRGRMGLNPLFEHREVAARGEFGEAGAEFLAVAAQIVAALQCDGPSAGSTPRVEDRSERCKWSYTRRRDRPRRPGERRRVCRDCRGSTRFR